MEQCLISLNQNYSYSELKYALDFLLYIMKFLARKKIDSKGK